MHDKRSQVTYFIIVGTVIIFLAVLLFMQIFDRDTNMDINLDDGEMISAENYFTYCLDTATKEGILRIAEKGMHYELPSDSQVTLDIDLKEDENLLDFAALPFYIKDNVSAMPSIDEVERNLGLQARDIFIGCAGHSELLFSEGYNYSLENVSVRVSVDATSITSSLESPILLSGKESEHSISHVNARIDYDLMRSYTLVQRFVEQQSKNTTYYEMGYLTDLAYNEGFRYENVFYNDSRVRYRLIFDDFKSIAGQPLVYAFMIKFEPGVEENEELAYY